jgi:hypothetical protein
MVIPATTQIVNRFSSGGVSVSLINTAAAGVEALSGAGTANTLASVLYVAGSGYVPYLICYSASATPAHTIRCQVLVDGISVFDVTSDVITTQAGKGFTVVDTIPQSSNYSVASGLPIRFNSSFEVKIASSQSGSDFVGIRYEYHKT